MFQLLLQASSTDWKQTPHKYKLIYEQCWWAKNLNYSINKSIHEDNLNSSTNFQLYWYRIFRLKAGFTMFCDFIIFKYIWINMRMDIVTSPDIFQTSPKKNLFYKSLHIKVLLFKKIEWVSYHLKRIFCNPRRNVELFMDRIKCKRSTSSYALRCIKFQISCFIGQTHRVNINCVRYGLSPLTWFVQSASLHRSS